MDLDRERIDRVVARFVEADREDFLDDAVSIRSGLDSADNLVEPYSGASTAVGLVKREIVLLAAAFGVTFER